MQPYLPGSALPLALADRVAHRPPVWFIAVTAPGDILPFLGSGRAGGGWHLLGMGWVVSAAGALAKEACG